MKRSPLVIAALLAALLLSAGCTQSSSLSVKLSDHPSVGSILTDSNGKALYFLAKDVPGTGKVTDLGEFSRYYPPFYAENVVSSPGINISDFGILTRTDGKKQTTYKGWPLYYYFNDKNEGDLKLDTASNIWFAIRPDFTLMVEEKDQPGLYLTDGAGKALYVYGNGSANSTTATPETTVVTPSVKNETGKTPFYTEQASGPTILNLRDFGVLKRLDGTKQSTWRGLPLAYSTADKLPGDTLGEGNGWTLVRLAPAVSIASFGNLTVPGQTVVSNQTPNQTPNQTTRTTATTTATTTVTTTGPTTVATSSTSTYVVPVYPVSNGDGSVYTPVTVNTTQTSSGSITQNTSQTFSTQTGQVTTTVTEKPVTSVTKTQVTTRTQATQSGLVTQTTSPTIQTTVPTQPSTVQTTQQTTVPSVTTTQPTTVPSLPTQAGTTVPPPVVPVSVQTTIPIPLPA
jgi:predicted lipoprotein with Yx(FWY)xxD motif